MPPIGPIGAHVTLSDKRWAFAIEATATGNFWNKFIVASTRDRAALNNLARSLRVRPVGVFVSPGSRGSMYNTTKPGLDADREAITTAYDLMKFDDAWVHNVVVDVHQPERQVCVCPASPSLIPTPAPGVQFSSQPPSPLNQALFDSRDKALRAIACGPRGGVAVAAWLCCFAVAPRGVGLLTWHWLSVLLPHTGRENMPKNVKRGLTQDSCSFTVRNGATTERMLHRGQGPTSAKFLAGTVDKKSQVCVCACVGATLGGQTFVLTHYIHTRVTDCQPATRN